MPNIKKSLEEKLKNHKTRRHTFLNFSTFYDIKNIARIEKKTQDEIYEKFLSEAIINWKKENSDFIDEKNFVLDFNLKQDIRIRKIKRRLAKIREQNLELFETEENKNE